MDNFREFQGYDLDECIQQAMEWFNSKREMLEVEIIQDAKSGIFGIVGARKAKIRARKSQMAETMRNLLSTTKAQLKQPASEEKALRSETELTKTVRSKGSDSHKNLKKTGGIKTENQMSVRLGQKGARHSLKTPSSPVEKKFIEKESVYVNPGSGKHGAPRQEKLEKYLDYQPNRHGAGEEDVGDGDSVVWPVTPVSELDQNKLKAMTLEVVKNLIVPLADKEPDMQFDLSQGYPRVRVQWEGDAGILIGRDGHTLVAVQYLASRILSRIMESSLRVRLDIGDYRARQSERLRDLALGLANKVRATGKSYSTRPLTSYHRRVIHLALHDAADIQTRSSGDGPLKRVIISPRRV